MTSSQFHDLRFHDLRFHDLRFQDLCIEAKSAKQNYLDSSKIPPKEKLENILVKEVNAKIFASKCKAIVDFIVTRNDINLLKIVLENIYTDYSFFPKYSIYPNNTGEIWYNLIFEGSNNFLEMFVISSYGMHIIRNNLNMFCDNFKKNFLVYSFLFKHSKKISRRESWISRLNSQYFLFKLTYIWHHQKPYEIINIFSTFFENFSFINDSCKKFLLKIFFNSSYAANFSDFMILMEKVGAYDKNKDFITYMKYAIENNFITKHFYVPGSNNKFVSIPWFDAERKRMILNLINSKI